MNRLIRSFGVVLTLASSMAMADKTAEVKQVRLINADAGTEKVIGTVSMQETKKGTYAATFTPDDSQFGDYFLSMRPFKCLETPEQLLCHLPYPYKNEHTISDENLGGLEYQFLFIRKAPNDYGINPWYGVYYKMQWVDQPGGAIKGVVHETDLDILAAPPSDP
ncbi:MAG: hypothetical protein ACPGPF_07650, partial [Pontibacterium sp.]